jgi:hypothetical protein
MPLLIALTLLLAVASGRIGMVLPIVLLIVGMGIAPLSAAVADHPRRTRGRFGAYGVGSHYASAPGIPGRLHTA